KKLDALADVARTVAKEQKVPLNDLRKAFVAYWKKHNPDNKPSGILTYDGNHFNQTGHEFVAEQMLKKLKKPDASQRRRGFTRVEETRHANFPHRIWAACDFEGRTPDYGWFGPA